MVAKFWESLHVSLAGLDFLIENDAVKALLAFVELVSEIEIGIGHESKLMEMAGHFHFGILDAFGDFDLLFAGKQRDLAHLLEIHPDRVIKDVEFLVGFDVLILAVAFVAFFVFVSINLGSIDDIKLHVAQALHDGLYVIGIDKIVWENLVDVVVGKVVLFLGELDEFADFFLDFRGVDPALVWLG